MRHRLWRAYVRAGEVKERILQYLRPGRMRIVNHGWPLRTDLCPCDLHFCDFLQERGISSRSIFHLGTGAHHVVGLRNHSAGLGNFILGVTISPNEYKRYLQSVVEDPVLGHHYQVLFADLYGIDARALPEFDIVNLFHLGEFGRTTASGHVRDEREVLELFCAKLRPGGLLVMYRGSFGYPKVKPLLDQMAAEGRLVPLENYKSLEFLQVPHRFVAAGAVPG